MSFFFRICKSFLVKLSPAFYVSRDKLYVDFTIKKIKSTTNQNSIKMLDVGGSDGNLAFLSYKSLTSVGFSVFPVVLDSFPSALRSGKKIRKALNYVCGDANHLPFKPRAFDIVCSYSVFEHLDRPKDAAEEMACVSKGLCVIQIPNMHYFIEPHTKAPLLYMFPNFVRNKVVQVTNIPYILNFSVFPANLIRWFRRANFNLVDALDVYHAEWTRLFKVPQGYLLRFQSPVNTGNPD